MNATTSVSVSVIQCDCNYKSERERECNLDFAASNIRTNLKLWCVPCLSCEYLANTHGVNHVHSGAKRARIARLSPWVEGRLPEAVPVRHHFTLCGAVGSLALRTRSERTDVDLHHSGLRCVFWFCAFACEFTPPRSLGRSRSRTSFAAGRYSAPSHRATLLPRPQAYTCTPRG